MELAQQSRGPNQGHLATCYVNNELLLGGRQQDLVELVLCEERALVDCLLCVMEVQEEEEDDEDEDKELPDKEHKEGRDNKFVAVAGVVFVWTCYVILPPLGLHATYEFARNGLIELLQHRLLNLAPVHLKLALTRNDFHLTIIVVPGGVVAVVATTTAPAVVVVAARCCIASVAYRAPVALGPLLEMVVVLVVMVLLVVIPIAERPRQFWVITRILVVVVVVVVVGGHVLLLLWLLLVVVVVVVVVGNIVEVLLLLIVRYHGALLSDELLYFVLFHVRNVHQTVVQLQFLLLGVLETLWRCDHVPCQIER
ncbi:Hypothetical predicted protein [Olea europaea subsp. europaea]|uniref:Uncharacterized protein n=1 Tax=Olea europaea subsp. europaea TaxID=158383 RepID=A0A8S0RBB7_OLEEU|nr:Hypothetical predicted protein [Olea europaea subsp. europaea]